MDVDHQLIEINLKDITVEADFSLPEEPLGFIIFSHGSGNNMNHPQNKLVAENLVKERLGYLLFDLLTPEEDLNFQNQFDLETLTQRLMGVTRWVEKNSHTSNLGIGYFGEGTGTAAALKATARMPGKIKTVVTRGGRADMALDELSKIDIPVLFIVGGLDERAIRLSEKAAEKLAYAETIIIEGISDLFEETSAFDELSDLATTWFKNKLN